MNVWGKRSFSIAFPTDGEFSSITTNTINSDGDGPIIVTSPDGTIFPGANGVITNSIRAIGGGPIAVTSTNGTSFLGAGGIIAHHIYNQGGFDPIILDSTTGTEIPGIGVRVNSINPLTVFDQVSIGSINGVRFPNAAGILVDAVTSFPGNTLNLSSDTLVTISGSGLEVDSGPLTAAEVRTNSILPDVGASPVSIGAASGVSLTGPVVGSSTFTTTGNITASAGNLVTGTVGTGRVITTALQSNYPFLDIVNLLGNITITSQDVNGGTRVVGYDVDADLDDVGLFCERDIVADAFRIKKIAAGGVFRANNESVPSRAYQSMLFQQFNPIGAGQVNALAANGLPLPIPITIPLNALKAGRSLEFNVMGHYTIPGVNNFLTFYLYGGAAGTTLMATFVMKTNTTGAFVFLFTLKLSIVVTTVGAGGTMNAYLDYNEFCDTAVPSLISRTVLFAFPAVNTTIANLFNLQVSANDPATDYVSSNATVDKYL